MTIDNLGTAPLTLDANSLSVPSGFSVPTLFVSSVAPGTSTTFAIRLDAAGEGHFAGSLSFANSDADESPYAFTLAGDVVPAQPEIVVAYTDPESGGNIDVADGSSTVSFGSTPVGTAVSRTFTVANAGLGTLTMTPDSWIVPAGFTLAAPPAPSVPADGSTTFTLQLDATSPGEFRGQFSLTNNDADEGVFRVVVSGEVMAPPVVASERYSVHHSQTLVIDAEHGVLANDPHDPSVTLQAVLVDDVTTGTLTLHSDGSFTYTPGDVGTVTFTYSATDGVNTPSPTTVAIEVWNYRPVGRDDFYRVHSGSALLEGSPAGAQAGVLLNDWDDDGDVFTAALASGPTHGSLTFYPNGAFVYSPALGFAGSDGFTYTIADSAQSGVAFADGRWPAGQIHVQIDVWNETPQTQARSYRVFHDQVLSVSPAEGLLPSDWDPDGDSVSIALTRSTAHGALTLNNDGSFQYTPAAAYVGPDSFVYTLTDGAAVSEETTVWIDVWNHIPEPHPDRYSTHAGTTLSVSAADGFIADDFEWDGDSRQGSVVSQPTHGTLTAVAADGSFTYQPDAGFVGPDSFTYKVSDGVQASEPATVTINVHNEKPYVYNQVYLVHAGTSLSVGAAFGVLGNAVDPDGDPLTAKLVGSPASGDLTWESDGSFTYTPRAKFVGVDSFTFRAHDGFEDSEIGSVTIHVTNEVPWALNDAYHIYQKQTLTTTASDGVMNNDLDYDDPKSDLTATIVDGPDHAAAFTFNTDGTFTYQPEPDFVGADTFTYALTDGTETANAKVVVDVQSAAPVGIADVYQGPRDTPLVIAASEGVLENDLEPIGKPSTRAAGDPMSSVLIAEQVTGTHHGTFSLNADGTFTYTPEDNFVGEDQFTYRAKNAAGLYSEETTVTIVIFSAVPKPFDDRYAVLLGMILNVSAAEGVLGNDYAAGAASVQAILAESPAYGAVTLNLDGSFVYTPGAALNNGTVQSDHFKYKLRDNAPSAEWATVTIDGLDMWLLGDAFSVKHDRRLTGIVRFSREDTLSDPVFAEVVSMPAGALRLHPDGTFDYVPAPGFAGTDVFTYQITNGKDAKGPATVAITVTNDLPIAHSDAYSVRHDRTLYISPSYGLLANDFDPDDELQGEFDALTAQLVGGPSAGAVTLEPDGSFEYTPPSQWAGTATFTYRVGDGLGWSPPATVTIQVRNAAPEAFGQSYGVYGGNTLEVGGAGSPVARARDDDGDEMHIEFLSFPTHGVFSFDPSLNGDFTYLPDAAYVGADSFRFRVTDGVTPSLERTVTIDVGRAGIDIYNDMDYATRGFTVTVGDSLTVGADQLTSIWYIDRRSPVGVLEAHVVEGPTKGTLVLGLNGSFTYTPNPANFYFNYPGGGQMPISGVDQFRYKLRDRLTGWESVPAQVQIYIKHRGGGSLPIPQFLAAGESATDLHDGITTVRLYNSGPGAIEILWLWGGLAIVRAVNPDADHYVSVFRGDTFAYGDLVWEGDCSGHLTLSADRNVTVTNPL